MNEILKNKIRKEFELFKTVIDRLYSGENKFDDLKGFKQFDAYTIRKCWGKFIKQINDGSNEEYLNFYVHIPFCRKKCSYCRYFSKQILNEEIHSNYVDYLIKLMQFFSKTFLTVKFTNLFVGGGTPSIFNCENLDKMFSHLFRYFKFNPEGWKVFETNPDSVTDEKLQLIKTYGFNNVSIGVQSVDYNVLNTANRDYQTYEMVAGAMELIKKYRFDRVNVDLMIGLKRDTAEYFVESFEKVASLQPSYITVYPLAVVDGYIPQEGLNYYFTSQAGMVREVARLIKPVLKEHHYTPEEFPLDKGYYGWGFRLKNGEKHFNDYYYDWFTSLTQEPYSLFGIGPTAYSRIYSQLLYIQDKSTSFEFHPLEKMYCGRKVTIKYEMLRYIIHCMTRESKISLPLFKKRFKIDFLKKFEYAISALKSLNKIEMNKDCIKFLPVTPKEQLLYLLFFLDEKEKKSSEAIVNAINQKLEISCFYSFE